MYSGVANNGPTLSGTITATGLTKMGPGHVTISGDNRGTLTGDVVSLSNSNNGQNYLWLANQYALGGSLSNPYAAGNNVTLNGGRRHMLNMQPS